VLLQLWFCLLCAALLLQLLFGLLQLALNLQSAAKHGCTTVVRLQDIATHVLALLQLVS
jgi:hypothetical protein